MVYTMHPLTTLGHGIFYVSFITLGHGIYYVLLTNLGHGIYYASLNYSSSSY